jgi:hypothetical protein
MPKILEDRRKAIARSNPKLSESQTWAIATSALQKEGKMPRTKKYDSGGKVSEATDAGTARGRETEVDAARDAAMRRYARQSYENTWRNDPEGKRKLEEKYGPLDESQFGTKAPLSISPMIRVHNRGGTVMGRQSGSFAQGGPPTGRTGTPGSKKY